MYILSDILFILLLYSQEISCTPVRWPPFLNTRALTLEPTGSPSNQYTVIAKPPSQQHFQCITKYRDEVQEIIEEKCSTNTSQDCDCTCSDSFCNEQPSCIPGNDTRRLKRCAITIQHKCFDKYQTKYKEECSHTYEKLCTTITVTKYVKNCVEEYPPECTVYGQCNSLPEVVCSDLPVTKQVDKCASVPQHSCKRIPIRRPRQFCHKVPSKKCKPVHKPPACKEPNYPTSTATCKELQQCKSQCENCLNTKLCHPITKLVTVQVPDVICQS